MRFLSEGHRFAYCGQLAYKQYHAADPWIPWDGQTPEHKMLWMGIAHCIITHHHIWEKLERRACEALADYSI
jgi:hypothetical protein